MTTPSPDSERERPLTSQSSAHTAADTPLVTVVIPAYNVTAFIGDALSSVLGQTYRDYEIIVVNDGSPDTLALEGALAPYWQRIRYVRQENRGLSGARNTGIQQARGDLIALLDADDVWLPHYLSDQVDRAIARPEISVFYGNATIIGDVPEVGRSFMDLSPSRGEVNYGSLVAQRCNVMVSAMVRRDALVQIGGFDETLRSSEDFDLWLRLAHAGAGFDYTTRVLALYRRRAGSLSADPVWMCTSIITVLDKCLATLPLSVEEKQATWDARRRFAALRTFHEGKRAFFQHDFVAARHALADANRVLRSPKIGLVLIGLRIMPRFVSLAYDARDRVRFKGARTKY